MKTRRAWYNGLAIVCVLALLLMFVRVPAAQAASQVTVDNFTTGATNLYVSYPDTEGSFPSSPAGLAGILGGQRDTCLKLIQNANGDGGRLRVNNVSKLVVMSLDDGVTAEARLQWDGSTNTDCPSLDPIGLRVAGVGVDLTGGTPGNPGPNTGIMLEIVSLDRKAVDFTVTIWTDSTHYSDNKLSLNTGITPPQHLDVFLPFAGFTQRGAGGPMDETNVGAVELFINAFTQSTDLSLKLMESNDTHEYGDLPASYGTGTGSILAANHIPQGLRLGDSVDAEEVPNASADALGDDTNQAPPDDEDGVVVEGNPWGTTGSLRISVKGCGTSCYLNGWIDWDQKDGFGGTYNGAPEYVIQNFNITNNDETNNLYSFSTPSDWATSKGFYYARFRVCKGASHCNTTTATEVLNGEVEDYMWYRDPLAVTLESFTAAPQAGNVLVSWATVSETDNAGFNLYRATSEDGEQTQVNPKLIPAQAPGSTDGHAYEWQDSDVAPGQTYFYWLEDLDLNGTRTMHGPVSATYAPDGTAAKPTSVRLQGLVAAAPMNAALPWAGALLLALGASAAIFRRRR